MKSASSLSEQTPPQQLPVDDKVSLKVAAMLLGVSLFTLRAWVRQRRLPFFRLGRRIVFSRQDLMEHLALCRVEAREPEAPAIPFDGAPFWGESQTHEPENGGGGRCL